MCFCRNYTKIRRRSRLGKCDREHRFCRRSVAKHSLLGVIDHQRKLAVRPSGIGGQIAHNGVEFLGARTGAALPTSSEFRYAPVVVALDEFRLPHRTDGEREGAGAHFGLPASDDNHLAIRVEERVFWAQARPGPEPIFDHKRFGLDGFGMRWPFRASGLRLSGCSTSEQAEDEQTD